MESSWLHDNENAAQLHYKGASLSIMKTLKRCALVCVAGVLTAYGASARATPLLDLYDWTLNADGTIYCPSVDGCGNNTLPGNIDGSGFDFGPGGIDGTGLGSISASITGTGSHYLGAFFDHEIDEPTNTYFNEYGQTSGTAAAGQSWEIDEPGYTYGDIYDNLLLGSLDNSNDVPASAPDDVSMAMGWDFTLKGNQQAIVTMLVSKIQPTSGFYLQQVDPDSNASLYLSSSLSIRTVGVPEPGTLPLLGVGLLIFAGRWRRVH